MKIFMFLHQCPFLHVSAPTKVSLDEYGLKVTKIRAQSTDYTQNQVDLLPPPFSLPSQLEELDDHFIRYSELRNTIVKNFNNDHQRSIMGVPYTHFGFDIYESPSPTSQGQGDHFTMEYQLKMKIKDDLGNDWLKILRRVCGGDKVKISLLLELGRDGVNGETLKATLGRSGMTILELNDSYFCVGPKLIANQVEELMALFNCGAPWAVFTGKITICLEIDEDIAIFTKQRSASINETAEQKDLAHVNLQILESGIDANVEIFPGEFGTPVKCHHKFLAVRSSVLQVMLQQPVREGEMKKIYMPEASENCVHALLRYLYTGDLTLCGEEDVILMELWKVAREYKIVELETEMKNKLGDKPVSGFSVGLAIDLFCWARNSVKDDAGSRLKEKAVLALKCKLAYDELESAPEYIRLFENDPVAARDLCKCAFQT